MSLPATIPCFGYDAAHFELTPLVFELARLEVGPRTRRAFAHRHSYCHLLWITAGQGVHMIDFEAYRLCPHALFFIAPRQVHHWVAETPVAGYSLKFSLEFLDQVVAASAALAGFPFERSRQAPAAYLTPEQAADVLPLIEQLTDEIAGESAAQAPHCHEMLAVLLRLLLLRLARLLPTPATGAPATPPPDVARRFFALLETHLLVLNKASDYAELLQSNVGRLDEALKRASGRTAAQLIRDRLLLVAKRRLMFTCQPVAELAFELGFADPAYFGRFFRQRTQLSPGDFRRRPSEWARKSTSPRPFRPNGAARIGLASAHTAHRRCLTFTPCSRFPDAPSDRIAALRRLHQEAPDHDRMNRNLLMKPKTILLTGAAGKLGRRLRLPLAQRYAHLRSTDLVPLEALSPNEDVQTCDLADAKAVARLLDGVDAVVHFAGYPREADWQTLVPANLIASVNMWEAALQAGVQRIVYASSNHVVGFHPVTEKIGIDAAVKCDSRYGVTKAFAETLASFYYEKFGLPSLGLRIGRCEDKPTDERMLAAWLHPDDMLQLVTLGLEQPLQADILYGVSRNSRALWLNPPSTRLPFVPAHSADDYAHEIEPGAVGKSASPFHGGYFADADYRGDAERATGHQRFST